VHKLLVSCALLASACAAAVEDEAPGAAAARGRGAAPALRSYNVDVDETSVSGLSSGAYFAQQMGVAFSSVIRGVGVIAGGPTTAAARTSSTAACTRASRA